ncbi:MAG: hypothetical protein UY92_C0021G0020 [Candidatus Magasanikbacteria bacterium GW2011_GWA2_56_11]|uniref:Phospholipid/glycerol acyltransferase domain-containing protein n=1 Tax=Candidatus Magasanikbacteria bacterium GW2011_GWA2_56_11 TaxID=1619044 RepID=A0A0G1YDR4_9BACT|nr:MAG: hypothetical protein UY92_C0021G0020 [Candidatus Magasanikbacteria bacterium GW2011_GWA2_56_11]
MFGFEKKLRQAFSETGIAGINREIETSRQDGAASASLWELLQRFTGAPEFLKDLERLEREIPAKGLGPVAKEFLERIGIEVVSEAPEWTRQTGAPVLFYGNHELGLEPQLLAALCARNDLSFVANHFVQNLGPGLQPHIFPVLARRYAKDSPAVLSPVEKAIMGEPTMTIEEIDKMNRDSLSGAASNISQGGAAGIFPSPGVDVSGHWYPGLGKIASDLALAHPDMADDIAVSPIYFEQPPVADLCEAVRTRYQERREPGKTYLNVKFGAIRSLREAARLGQTPEEITERLRSDYLEEFRLT